MDKRTIRNTATGESQDYSGECLRLWLLGTVSAQAEFRPYRSGSKIVRGVTVLDLATPRYFTERCRITSMETESKRTGKLKCFATTEDGSLEQEILARMLGVNPWLVWSDFVYPGKTEIRLSRSDWHIRHAPSKSRFLIFEFDPGSIPHHPGDVILYIRTEKEL